MKKLFLTLVSAFAFSLLLSAQGTDALSFTRIDRNPVTSGFAGAGSVSHLNAAYSAFSNTSGLVMDEQGLCASLSYQLWAPGAAPSNNLAAGVSAKTSKRFALAFGFSRDMLAPYELFNSNGLSAGKYTPTQTQMAIGLSFAFGQKLSLGVSARYAFERLAKDTVYDGIGADVMFGYKFSDTFRMSAGLANIGTPLVSTDKKKYNQPASAKLSVAWFMPLGSDRIDVMSDADYYLFSGGISASLGVQYALKDFLFFRTGYRFASDKAPVPGYLSVGVGGKYKFFTLDVSYLTLSKVLGNTLSVGLGYSF